MMDSIEEKIEVGKLDHDEFAICLVLNHFG